MTFARLCKKSLCCRVYLCSRSGPPGSHCHPELFGAFRSFRCCGSKTRKNTCKCCTGATWRSKWPAPACSGAASVLEGAVRACFGAAGALKMAALACPGAASALGKADRACLGAASAIKMAPLACSGFGQCAQRGCPSLLRCRQCAQRDFSSVLFEIAVRKSWSRLHCALSHCTLHCFAPCMDMHGSTLVHIHLYKCSRAGPQRSHSHPELNQLSLKMAQKGSKKRKKAQKGSKRRSRKLFEPARCRQCAGRGCSSLLRCRLCF